MRGSLLRSNMSEDVVSRAGIDLQTAYEEKLLPLERRHDFQEFHPAPPPDFTSKPLVAVVGAAGAGKTALVSWLLGRRALPAAAAACSTTAFVYGAGEALLPGPSALASPHGKPFAQLKKLGNAFLRWWCATRSRCGRCRWWSAAAAARRWRSCRRRRTCCWCWWRRAAPPTCRRSCRRCWPSAPTPRACCSPRPTPCPTSSCCASTGRSCGRSHRRCRRRTRRGCWWCRRATGGGLPGCGRSTGGTRPSCWPSCARRRASPAPSGCRRWPSAPRSRSCTPRSPPGSPAASGDGIVRGGAFDGLKGAGAEGDKDGFNTCHSSGAVNDHTENKRRPALSAPGDYEEEEQQDAGDAADLAGCQGDVARRVVQSTAALAPAAEEGQLPVSTRAITL